MTRRRTKAEPAEGERKFFVMAFVDATKADYIVAPSAEEALASAQESITNPSVCHQCSGEMEVGEIYDWEVMDGDQEAVLIPREHGSTPAEVEALREALSGLAEAARNSCHAAKHPELSDALFEADRVLAGGAGQTKP